MTGSGISQPDVHQQGFGDAIPSRATDWSKCCLCQLNNKDTTSPATNGYPEAYRTLVRNLVAIDTIHELPFPLDIRHLDNGSAIESTLLDNKAVLRKQCRKKFDDEKVQWAQKKAKVKDDSPEVLPSPRKTRRTGDAKCDTREPECLLCPSCKYSGESVTERKEKKKNERLVKASTYDIDETFKYYTTKTNDNLLLAKLLTASDLHAMDASYHKSWSSDLYHRARSITHQQTSLDVDDNAKSLEAMAFAQLVAYIGEVPDEVYKLRDMVDLYKEKLA